MIYKRSIFRRLRYKELSRIVSFKYQGQPTDSSDSQRLQDQQFYAATEPITPLVREQVT